MGSEERLAVYHFPEEVDGVILSLRERARKTGSLRIAVAHQIEEEGLLLRSMTAKFFPQDSERKAAVDEYTLVGTLILETIDASLSGNYEAGQFEKLLAGAQGPERSRFLQEKRQVDLLQEDPTGFSLLTWWVNKGLEEPKSQGIVIGRINGVNRYKKLYQASKNNGASEHI